jgi:hypothetical protein
MKALNSDYTKKLGTPDFLSRIVAQREVSDTQALNSISATVPLTCGNRVLATISEYS